MRNHLSRALLQINQPSVNAVNDAICIIFNSAMAVPTGNKRYNIEKQIVGCNIHFGEFTTHIVLGAAPIDMVGDKDHRRYKLYLVVSSLHDGNVYGKTDDTDEVSSNAQYLDGILDIDAVDTSAVPENFGATTCEVASTLLGSALIKLKQHLLYPGFAYENYSHYVHTKFMDAVDGSGENRGASLPMLVLMAKVFNVMPNIMQSYLWDDIRKFLYHDDGKCLTDVNLVSRDNQHPEDINYLVRSFINKGLVTRTEVDMYLYHATHHIGALVNGKALSKIVTDSGENGVIRLARTLANLIMVTTSSELCATAGKLLRLADDLFWVVSNILKGMSAENQLDIVFSSLKARIKTYVDETTKCHTVPAKVYSPRNHEYVKGYVDMSGFRYHQGNDNPLRLMPEEFSNLKGCGGYDMAAFPIDGTPRAMTDSLFKGAIFYHNIPVIAVFGVMFEGFAFPGLLFKPFCSEIEVSDLVLMRNECYEELYTYGIDAEHYMLSVVMGWMRSGYGWVGKDDSIIPNESFIVKRLSKRDDGRARLLDLVVMLADAVPYADGRLLMQFKLACMVFPYQLSYTKDKDGLIIPGEPITAIQINDRNYASVNRDSTVALLARLFGGAYNCPGNVVDYAQITALTQCGNYPSVVESAVCTVLRLTTNPNIEKVGRHVEQCLLSDYFDPLAELVNLFDLKHAHAYARQVSEQVIDLWSNFSVQNRVEDGSVDYVTLLDISEVMRRFLTSEYLPVNLWFDGEANMEVIDCPFNASAIYRNYAHITLDNGRDRNFIVCVNGYPYHVKTRYLFVAITEAGIKSGILLGQESCSSKLGVETVRAVFKANLLVVTEIKEDYSCTSPLVLKGTPVVDKYVPVKRDSKKPGESGDSEEQDYAWIRDDPSHPAYTTTKHSEADADDVARPQHEV